jgi:hypothetical protein
VQTALNLAPSSMNGYYPGFNKSRLLPAELFNLATIMDPLSLAASVAGLVGLGEQIFSAAFKYAQAVRYAEEDIASSVKELTGLLKVLKETE